MKIFKNNFLVKFVVALFLIGITIGFLFFLAYKPDLSTNIEAFKDLLLTTNQNTFLSSIILISAIFVLSISIIGLPAIVFYIFYEGLSIGFTLALFATLYGIKGFFFYILFFFFSKAIYIALMLYFSILSIRFIIKLIDAILSKSKDELYRVVVYHFYRFMIVLFGILVNSTAIYLFSNKILRLFSGLI